MLGGVNAGTQLNGIQNSAGYDYIFGLGCGTTNGNGAVWIGGTSYNTTPTFSIGAGVTSRLGLSFSAPGSFVLYVSGVNQGSPVTLPSGSVPFASTSIITMQYVAHNTSVYVGFQTATSMIWNVTLSDADHAWVNAAPFSMLEPIEGPIWFPVSSGGGGTTLLLAQKSWGWSPTGPLLQFDVALAQKDWGWTSRAPVVSEETQLTLAQKSWGWTKQAPVLSQGVALAQKAWGWTAQAPVVRQSISLAQKAWNWFGQAPIIGQPTVIQLARATWGWVAGAWAGALAQGGIVRGGIVGFIRGIVRR